MSVSILRRRWLCIGVLLTPIGGALAQDEKKNEALDPTTVVTEFAKVREILASVDELPPRKARWVKVQLGVGKDESLRQGWLVSEKSDAIEVLEDGGYVSVLSKKKLAEKAPVAEYAGFDVRAVTEADFAAYCRAALTKKKEPNKDDGLFGAYRMSRDIHEAQQEILLFARLACWARETGDIDLISELAARSMRLYRAHLNTYPHWGTQTEFHRFVAHNAYPRTKPGSTSVANALSAGERDRRLERVDQLVNLKRLAKIPYRPKLCWFSLIWKNRLVELASKRSGHVFRV